VPNIFDQGCARARARVCVCNAIKALKINLFLKKLKCGSDSLNDNLKIVIIFYSEIAWNIHDGH